MATTIDIRENEAFENGWFIASLVVIALMALSVVAALTGVLGGGPLARAKVHLAHSPVQIGYERFVRVQTPSRMDISIARDLGHDTVEVRLDAAFLSARDIKEVLPRPAATRVEKDGLTYLFPLGSARQGQVTFWLSPNTPGAAAGTIAVDGDAVPIRQFIYP